MKRSLRLPLFITVVLFVAAGACVVRAEGEPPTAEALLQKMAATYAEAHSYADTSVANYRNPDGSERLNVEFRTWFARPAHFRLDASSARPGMPAPRREVMWSDGKMARTWATDRAVSTRPKVQFVGSGMFGTYAYHVSTLLDANFGKNKRLHELDSPKITGEENFEGTDCYRIGGEFHGSPYELWLGKADHLLRKLVAKYPDHEMEEIHRNVTLNSAIPLEVFRFAPEAEAAPPPKKK